MKKELKFRAFNGQEINYSIMTGKFGSFWVNPGVNNNGLDENDKASLTPFNTKCSDATEIMQFTGLKDRNDKDIYVSDILSGKWLVEVYQNNEGTFMVKFHNNPLKNKSMSLKRYLSSREIAGCGDRDCIVIGNIFENPELLHTGGQAGN